MELYNYNGPLKNNYLDQEEHSIESFYYVNWVEYGTCRKLHVSTLCTLQVVVSCMYIHIQETSGPYQS